MQFDVAFRPEAENNLFELCRYIAADGGPVVAARYIERIEAACLGFGTLPQRGRPRDDLSPGLHTIAFERRATIAYRVIGRKAVIVRIFYGGRNYGPILRAIPEF